MYFGAAPRRSGNPKVCQAVSVCTGVTPPIRTTKIHFIRSTTFRGKGRYVHVRNYQASGRFHHKPNERHARVFPQIAVGAPPDVPVFALRQHPLTITTYNLEELATRIPHGTIHWAALVTAADPLATSATIPRGMIAYTSGTTGRPKGVRRFPPSPEEATAFTELMTQMFQRGWGLSPDARWRVMTALNVEENVATKAKNSPGETYARKVLSNWNGTHVADACI